MRKVKDLAVVTGTYQKDGETKKRYRTIGAVMENENGQFIFLDRSFNPAGIPFKEGADSIMVSMFDPKGNEQPPASKPVPAAVADDIPFD